MTPKLRFPEFTDKWSLFKLGSFIEEIAMGPFGSNLKVDMFKESGVPIIKGSNIKHKYVSGPYSYVSESKADSLGKSVAHPGDFIITHRGTLGQIAIVPTGDYPRYVTSQSQLRFRLRQSDLLNDWTIQYFNTKAGIKRMLVDAGQVGVPAISFPTSSIKTIEIIMPSIVEQTIIADFLTAVDEKISLLEQEVELMQKYKEGVMQALLSGKLRFKDEIGNPYPDWEEKKLGGLVKFYRGNLLSKADIITDGRYKCVHYGELFTEYNEVIRDIKSSTNVDTKSMSKVGDILMPTSDVTPQGLAKASVISEAGVMLGGDINILRPNSNISPVFLSYMINLQKKKIMRLVSGSTVRHIYSKDITKIIYRIPASFEEQQKIADFLVALDDKIKLEEAKLAKSKDFKKALLQRMFI